jgi:hypothetical protein
MTVDDLLREARERIDRVTPEEAAREIEDGALQVDTRCARSASPRWAGVVPWAPGGASA